MRIIGNSKPSKEIEKFISIVSKEFKLEEWRIQFWDIKNENECIKDFKLIYIDKTKKDEQIKYWILHEVTHALISDFNVNHNHLIEWEIKFNELLKKYIQEPNKILRLRNQQKKILKGNLM